MAVTLICAKDTCRAWFLQTISALVQAFIAQAAINFIAINAGEKIMLDALAAFFRHYFMYQL
jgi:succinate dehydrogenase hydrophobic anchor subunit